MQAFFFFYKKQRVFYNSLFERLYFLAFVSARAIWH